MGPSLVFEVSEVTEGNEANEVNKARGREDSTLALVVVN